MSSIPPTAVAIYCSGSIVKGHADEKKLCWTDAERAAVSIGAAPTRVVFFNPDDPITDALNTLGQFGRDIFQVLSASAIVVDARERRGLGVGVEIAAASAMGIPVVVVAPVGSKYRQALVEYRGVRVDQYVHPHVAALATVIVDNFEQAGAALNRIQLAHTDFRQAPAWLREPLHEYRGSMLPTDQPMLDALAELDEYRQMSQ